MAQAASGRSIDAAPVDPRRAATAPCRPARPRPAGETEDEAEVALEELIAGDDDDLALIAGAIRRLSEVATGPASEPSRRRRLGRLAFAEGGRIVPELPDANQADEVESALDDILRMRLGGAGKAPAVDRVAVDEAVACRGIDEFVCHL
ncbi:MAG: hypothetical protein M0004_12745 [Actinomycetota bacterium]|nr:hypothetical protein [Actinomycetota bacterium]